MWSQRSRSFFAYFSFRFRLGWCAWESIVGKQVWLGRWRPAIVAVAVLFCVFKIVINWNTYGSTDALLWETNLQTLQHSGATELYRGGTNLRDEGGIYHHEVFNHPPFMIHLVSWWGALAEFTGRPMRFWMRLTCSAADIAGVFLLLALLRRMPSRPDPGSLLLVAASPVSLMISGFHGNTDPIMIALLLLSIFWLETGPAMLAGAALGMAANIKIVPLLFAPALFFSLRGRKKIEFAAGGLLMFAAGSMPTIVENPALVARNVFGYSPQSGIWGLPAFVTILGTPEFLAVFAQVTKVASIALMVVASIWMNRGERRPHRLLQCALLSFVLLAFTPGFGVQYLAWVVPFTCLLRLREALAFHASAAVFLFSYYTRAGGGFPWYLANSVIHKVWNLPMVMLGLVCWGIVCFLGSRLYARVRQTRVDAAVSADVPIMGHKALP